MSDMERWMPALARPGPELKGGVSLKSRNFLFSLALILLIVLPGCGRDASESPRLSGEAPELSDIAGHPAEEAIREGLRRGLYPAPSDGLFRPDEAATGGDFVIALWNLAGNPDGNPSNDGDEQLRQALAWADESGFLDGGAFDADKPITRQEAMDILYAYNGGGVGMEAMLTSVYDNAFLDSGEIPDGGKPALYWGFFNVLIREPEPDKIAPSGTVSRGDMAAMMVRYMDDFQSESPEN